MYLPMIIIFFCSKFVKMDNIPPNTGLNATQQIEYYGYQGEIHEVTTDDGYILQLYRIPYGLNNTSSDNKTVVFLMPGLLSSSGIFLIHGRNSSLPYILTDLNYDVWIGNARGTTYSRKHVALDPDVDKAQFFNFSIHEVGYYDTRNSIDYILNVTNQNDVIYIGYSQGTTDFLIMASEFPEYNDKIRLAVLLGPIAFLSHMIAPGYRLLALFTDELLALTTSLNLYELFNYSYIYLVVQIIITAVGFPLDFIEATVIFAFAGFDYPQFLYSIMPLLTSVAPAGTSAYQLAHYGQLMNTGSNLNCHFLWSYKGHCSRKFLPLCSRMSNFTPGAIFVQIGRFQRYDYGPSQNLVAYGQTVVPEYNVANVTAPVAIYHGLNDWCAAVADVEILAAALPNLVKKYVVPYDLWSHLDFGFAKEASLYVYDDVVDLLSQYG